MKSSTTPDFRACFIDLPPEIKARAKTAYQLWKRNPRHPSLKFRKVGTIWSIRIGGGYRALAILEKDTFFWFWIGNHDDYERLIPVSR
jgi:hypothetical protein